MIAFNIVYFIHVNANSYLYSNRYGQNPKTETTAAINSPNDR
jgi:hypothetical protein